MNKHNLAVLTLLMIVSLTTSLSAQIMRSAEEKLNELTKELNLSEEQQISIKSILQKSQEKLSSLKEKSTSNRRAKLMELKEIMEDTNDQIRKVLNEDQLEKFDELVEKRKNEIRNKIKKQRNY